MAAEIPIDHELRREYRDLPDDDAGAPAADLDPVAALAVLDSLGAERSPAFSRPGPLEFTSRDCVLCPGMECECASVEFGSDHYFAKLDAIHGRNRSQS